MATLTPTPKPVKAVKLSPVNNHVYRADYLSVHEALQACAGDMPTGTSTETGHGMDWDGGLGYAEAMKLSTGGWTGGNNAVIMAEKITRSILPETGVGMEMGISGVCVDVGTYLSGEPECMVNMVETNAERRVVRVAVNMSISASIDTQSLLDRGSIIMALVNCLELSGISTEISAFDSAVGYTAADGRPRVGVASVILKRAGDAFNRQQTAFLCSHSAAERRFFFRLWECKVDGSEDSIHRAVGGTLGSPCELPACYPRGDVYFPELCSATSYQPGEMEQQVRDHLAALGVKC